MALLQKLTTKVFFWTKKGPQIPKAEEAILAFLKYLPEIRKRVKEEQNKMFNGEGDLLKRMYDFYAGFRNGDDDIQVPGIVPWGQQQALTGGTEPNADARETKTPMEVAGQLEKIPMKVDMVDLDEKINMFKSKSRLVSQRFTKDQIDGFIERLLNRKHYDAHHKFYEQYPCTNDDAIDVLLSKYKLVMKKSDLFVPTFPKEAIDIMEKYTLETKKFTQEAPVFYVIAEERDFQKKQKKLDPILLVQSPFGFFWQILGAWDKEMLLLGEL